MTILPSPSRSSKLSLAGSYPKQNCFSHFGHYDLDLTALKVLEKSKKKLKWAYSWYLGSEMFN